jgi:hypothetical protein
MRLISKSYLTAPGPCTRQAFSDRDVKGRKKIWSSILLVEALSHVENLATLLTLISSSPLYCRYTISFYSFKMMSLRTVARSAPRSLTRLSSSVARQSAVARPSSLLKSSWAPLRTSQFASAFSTTPLRWAPAGEVDEELSVKLESELRFEGEMKENEQLPASVKDFLENSSFELLDTPGKEDVILKRTFGNET